MIALVARDADRLLRRFNTERPEVIADRIFTYAINSVLVAEGAVVVIAMMLWEFGLLDNF